ncbi:FCPF [Symbiodinium sp. CCMP2592]|nr:FCPF [Symbiodinium sp. CCMP2592]
MRRTQQKGGGRDGPEMSSPCTCSNKLSSALDQPTCSLVAMPVDWAVQALTVALTLLIVLVVRDVQAWLSPVSPKPVPRPPAEEEKPAPEEDKDVASATAPQVTSPSQDATPATKDDSVQDSGSAVPDPVKVSTPVAAQGTPTADGDGTDQTSQSDNKPTGPDADSGSKKAMTPEMMMQELQACHTTVKNFAANMSRLLNGITSVAPNLAKVQTELENNQKAASTLEAVVEKAVAKMDKGPQDDLKELIKRISSLESIVGAVTAKMGTMSQNVDTFGKSSDSQLKDVLKSVSAVASSGKQQGVDVSGLVTAKSSMLESGLKEVLRKITQTDYDSCTSITQHVKDVHNQVYDLGQELLAALHFLQGEATTQKENLYQLATAVADIAEQVRVIRDYCERPVPMAVSAHHDEPPMPPPAYAPHVGQGPRQLNLNTALPARTTGGLPQVRVDVGNGRSITIPLSGGM